MEWDASKPWYHRSLLRAQPRHPSGISGRCVTVRSDGCVTCSKHTETTSFGERFPSQYARYADVQATAYSTDP